MRHRPVLTGAFAFLLAVLVVPTAVAVVGGALAPTADRSPRAAVRAATGNVLITNSAEGSAVLHGERMVPGDSVTGTVTIGNGGDTAGVLTLSGDGLAEIPGVGGGRLAQALTLTVTDLTGATTVYTGPLDRFASVDLGTLIPGEAHVYRFTARFDSAGALDDAYMLAQARVDFDWSMISADRVPPPPGAPYADQVAFDQPRHWWRLGEPKASDAIIDAVGGKPGTWKNGVVLGAGNGPGGLTSAQFDGRATYGYVNGVNAFTGGYTLEAWVRPQGTSAGTIVEHGADGALYAGPSGVSMRATNATISAPGALSAGAWHHVAGTWDAGTGLAALYVDGVLRAQGVATKPPSGTPTLYIGYGQSAPWFTGHIAEVAYYDRALGALRIQAHSGAGNRAAAVATKKPKPKARKHRKHRKHKRKPAPRHKRTRQ